MELALGGLNVSLRDYAKLGWLYLNQGTWTDNQNNIQQIVPKQWTIDSTKADAPHLVAGEIIQRQRLHLVMDTNGCCHLILKTNLQLKAFMTNIYSATLI
jgi:CubicO group peptidase (beta-lactamase class C family)